MQEFDGRVQNPIFSRWRIQAWRRGIPRCRHLSLNKHIEWEFALILRRFLISLALAQVACCAGAAWAGALDAPRGAGMRELGGGIFVDPDMSPEQLPWLPRLVEGARRRLALYYGAAAARPNIVFCASADCYSRFGGVGLGFSDGANILIAPQGQRIAIVAHELAHVELANRLGGLERVMEHIPQWFDEGQAVMVSFAGEFTEDAWLEATVDGALAPPLSELSAINDWVKLTGPNGENMQMTYGTARREVSRWFSVVGIDGLADLLTALETREPFAEAYLRIEGVYRAAASASQEMADDGEARAGKAAKPFVAPINKGRAAW